LKTKYEGTVGFVNSLVDVMHDLHDNLNFPFGVQKNTVHHTMLIKIHGEHPRDDVHASQLLVVSIADEEL
jgi:hypothetical protein